MNKTLLKFVKLFYPDRCPYCNIVIESGKIACETCMSVFPEDNCLNYAKGGYRCYSPFFYTGIFATAVKRFKFNGRAQYAPQLAVKICDAVISLKGDKKYDVITCVPMHKNKKNRRGYNQSELLAKECADLLGLPYENLLEKIKENIEQHRCDSAAKRRENVKGVYKAINKEKIEGKSILIIDDILTTGYTLGECCKQLEKGGAKSVECAVLCARNNL